MTDDRLRELERRIFAQGETTALPLFKWEMIKAGRFYAELADTPYSETLRAYNLIVNGERVHFARELPSTLDYNRSARSKAKGRGEISAPIHAAMITSIYQERQHPLFSPIAARLEELAQHHSHGNICFGSLVYQNKRATLHEFTPNGCRAKRTIDAPALAGRYEPTRFFTCADQEGNIQEPTPYAKRFIESAFCQPYGMLISALQHFSRRTDFAGRRRNPDLPPEIRLWLPPLNERLRTRRMLSLTYDSPLRQLNIQTQHEIAGLNAIPFYRCEKIEP